MHNPSHSSHKVGFTEAQILERAEGRLERGGFVAVRCLNETAHQHGDRHASAYYNTNIGWYGCRVCDLRGFASDRDRDDYAARHKRYAYSNASIAHRTDSPQGKKYWQEISSRERDGEKPKPYGFEQIDSLTRRVYVVEGEKCVDALQPHLNPKLEAVVTSKQGTGSSHKTDWSPLSAKTDTCEIIFLPDCDEPGDKYIQSVADQLNLDRILVVRLEGPNGYDIADWLEEGHSIAELPAPAIEFLHIATDIEEDSFTPPYIRPVQPHRIIPERDWIVRDWLATGAITLLAGEGGKGKSSIALQLSADVATGNDGQPAIENSSFQVAKNAEPALVLFVSWEDDADEVDRRARLLEISDNGKVHFVEALGRGPLWAPQGASTHTSTHGGWTDLAEWLFTEIGVRRYRLVILDPLASIYGCNENDRALVREFMSALHLQAANLRCAILVIAHPPKSDSAYSGSTDWHAAARTVLTLTEEKSGEGLDRRPTGNLVLSCIKSNYGHRPKPIVLQRSDPDAYSRFAAIENHRMVKESMI